MKMSDTPKLVTGTDSNLTVANGITPVILRTIQIPATTGTFDHMTAIVVGNYIGLNDSFKTNAASGSYMEAYIEIQTINNIGTWTRITPSSDAYRLYQNDVHDAIVIDCITGMSTQLEMGARVQLTVVLSEVPTDTIDLDWVMTFHP
jgi:hypothetical protein